MHIRGKDNNLATFVSLYWEIMSFTPPLQISMYSETCKGRWVDDARSLTLK